MANLILKRATLSFSCIMTIFGVTGNTFSLYYFLSRVDGRTARNHKSSTTHLFVTLNCFDLLVCVSCFSISLYKLVVHDEDDMFHDLMDAIFFLAEEMTYFIVCLLSFRRLINLVWPMYLVKRRSMNIAIAIFSASLILLEILHWTLMSEFESMMDSVDRVRSLIRLFLILIIIFSSIMSFVKLNQSYSQSHHKLIRYATVTTGILAAIFCACNLAPMIASGFYAFHHAGKNSVSRALHYVFFHVLVPLNSTCNPLVYLRRRADMRCFFQHKWRNLRGRFGRDSSPASEVAQEKKTVERDQVTC